MRMRMKRGAVWRKADKFHDSRQQTMKHAMNALVSCCFHGPLTGAELMEANEIAKWEEDYDVHDA